ncbi:MAG: hypothetical protein ACKO7P_11630 [Bacteroidota bacterium]
MNLDTNYSKIYQTFDKDTLESANKNRFSYIHAKAEIYLKLGPDLYRKKDFFQMPDKSWDKNEILLIETGCQQILQGKGLTAKNPLSGLGVGGFYNLLSTFHFKPKNRITKRLKKDGEIQFLDIIEFEHFVDQTIVTYCNLVAH